jgi:hypothetical protein
MKKTILFSIVLFLANLSNDVLAQGTFQNLDFEMANVPSLPFGQEGGFVSVGSALPGWSAYVGGIQASSILHNSQTLASAFVGIWGPQSLPGTVFQGSYAVALGADFDSNPATRRSAAISQTGQIPVGAKSIRYLAQTASLELSFAGQTIPVASLGGFPDYSIYGADISAYAGQTGELRFTVPVSGAFLDFIQFSNQPIPEPSAVVLLGLGALLFGYRSRPLSTS